MSLNLFCLKIVDKSISARPFKTSGFLKQHLDLDKTDPESGESLIQTIWDAVNLSSHQKSVELMFNTYLFVRNPKIISSNTSARVRLNKEGSERKFDHTEGSSDLTHVRLDSSACRTDSCVKAGKYTLKEPLLKGNMYATHTHHKRETFRVWDASDETVSDFESEKYEIYDKKTGNLKPWVREWTSSPNLQQLSYGEVSAWSIISIKQGRLNPDHKRRECVIVWTETRSQSSASFRRLW